MTEEEARNHPGVLVGVRRVRRAASKPNGWSTADIAGARAASARLNASEKGREYDRRYSGSEKGREKRRARNQRYKLSLRGQLTRMRCDVKRRIVVNSAKLEALCG